MKRVKKYWELDEEAVQEVYEDYYIGQSMGVTKCAWLLDTNDANLRRCFRFLQLRLRNGEQARQAKEGERWQWEK